MGCLQQWWSVGEGRKCEKGWRHEESDLASMLELYIFNNLVIVKDKESVKI
ncbi:MAG: hypothetical protein ABWU14_18435 [Limnospira maxima]